MLHSTSLRGVIERCSGSLPSSAFVALIGERGANLARDWRRRLVLRRPYDHQTVAGDDGASLRHPIAEADRWDAQTRWLAPAPCPPHSPPPLVPRSQAAPSQAPFAPGPIAFERIPKAAGDPRIAPLARHGSRRLPTANALAARRSKAS